MTHALRIAILTHSTNPRGGVAHALALGEALTELGHEAVVHAPDATGRGFYRKAACKTVCIPAKSVAGDTLDLVRTRVNDNLAHFATPAACDFDVFHAQDGISGNALATLTRRRLIHAFVRTVHHVDEFDDPQLAQLQERAILDAARVLCVSRVWKAQLQRVFGRDAVCIGNGVDTAAFTPNADGAEAVLRTEWGLGPGPVFLSVGGFEERKNSLRIIEALALLRSVAPQAQLVVAGGASLLDHASYQARCRAAIEAAGLEIGIGKAVVATGPLPQAVIPALYRVADALVFPSLKEGFGLAVLEAMACGTPTIVSRIAPFTEYLGASDTLFTEPEHVTAIAAAMRAALTPGVRDRLRRPAAAVVGAHSWRACAEAHLDVYAACARPERELADA